MVFFHAKIYLFILHFLSTACFGKQKLCASEFVRQTDNDN